MPKTFGPMFRFDDLLAEFKRCTSVEDMRALMAQYQEMQTLYSGARPGEIRGWLAEGGAAAESRAADPDAELDLSSELGQDISFEREGLAVTLSEMNSGESAQRHKMSAAVREEFLVAAGDAGMTGLEQMDAHPVLSSLYHFCTAEEKSFMVRELAQEPYSPELAEFVVGKVINVQTKFNRREMALSDEELIDYARDIPFAATLMGNLEALCDGSAFDGQDLLAENDGVYKNFLRGIARKEEAHLTEAKLRLEIMANPYYAVFPEKELLAMDSESLREVCNRVVRKSADLQEGVPEMDESLQEEDRETVRDGDSLRAYFNLIMLRKQQMSRTLEGIINEKLVNRNLTGDDVLFLDEDGRILMMEGQQGERVPMDPATAAARMQENTHLRYTCVKREAGEDGQPAAGRVLGVFQNDGDPDDPGLEFDPRQMTRRLARQTDALVEELDRVDNVWFGSGEFSAVKAGMQQMQELAERFRKSDIDIRGAAMLQDALREVMKVSAEYLDMKQTQRGTLSVTKESERSRIEAVMAVHDYAEAQIAALNPQVIRADPEKQRDAAFADQRVSVHVANLRGRAQLYKNEQVDRPGKELKELHALACGSMDYLALYAGSGLPVAAEHRELLYESMASAVAYRMIYEEYESSGTSALESSVLKTVGSHGMIRAVCENPKFRELVGELTPQKLSDFLMKAGDRQLCEGLKDEKIDFRKPEASGKEQDPKQLGGPEQPPTVSVG